MRRALTAIAALFTLTAVGCVDQQATSPSTPRFALSAGGPCSFSNIGSLVNAYFTSEDERSAVGAIVIGMQGAGAFTTAAQDSGFSVLSHLAANVDAGNADSVDGSALANATLGCMYSDTAQLPVHFPENFLTATDPSSTGGFQVRGTAGDGASAPIYNRPYAAPFSAMAPPTGSTWAAILSGNAAPQRILAYGRAGSNTSTYDWKVLPRGTTFSPGVVVGVCADAGAFATSMLDEQHVGLLSFVLVSTDVLPATCSPTVALSRPSPALEFARRVGDLFAVPAAWAYAGGIGGSTGSINSEFSALGLTGGNVDVAFTVQPPATVTVCSTPPCGTGFSVSLQTTSGTTAGTLSVGGTTVHLRSFDNNGQKTQLVQCVGSVCTDDPVATTGNNGIATFTGLFVTKNGAVRLMVTDGTVNGRGAISVGTATSTKINVKPH